MPHPVPSPIWSLLHRTILNIPPTRLPLFPLLSGTVWFLTLTSLLLRWITRGRKPYPGQIHSSVPFISDIASFELKPLFLVGASITAGGFFITVVAVHVVAFEPGFALITTSHGASNDEERDEDEDEDWDENEDERNSKTLHIISLVSICAAGLASLSLILLSVMDTFRYSIAHDILLRLCFAGLAVQALGTAIVYADDVGGFRVCSWSWCRCWTSRRQGQSESEDEDENGNGRNIRRTSKRVRIFETLSTLLLLVELLLATAFLSLSISAEVDTKHRIAAILEWVIAYLGTMYLWLFVGFFESARFEGLVPRSFARGFRGGESGDGSSSRRDGEGEGQGDAERAPLLREASLDRKYT
ncbi:Frag1/DRAM/Sfk1 family-domain-containing protein [Aspergillus venezuelensis]